MTTLTLTTWAGLDKYRVRCSGTGARFGNWYHVRAESENGGRISCLISREAFDRLPAVFDVGHVLAEGGEIL